MTEPRFAVCTVGDDGFSVKDRKTSQRLGYYRTQAEAEKARDAFNRLYLEEEVINDQPPPRACCGRPDFSASDSPPRPSGEQCRARVGELQVGSALMPPQPSLRDGALDTGAEVVASAALIRSI